MQCPHNRFHANTTQQQLPRVFGGKGCVVFALYLFMCGFVSPVQSVAISTSLNVIPISYTFVFIIHGDGEYVYHDSNGNAHKADRKAMAGAIKVALRNPHAEVFIYYQRPRGHAFFIFPLRDGAFRYYRHGLLIAEELYWRDQGPSRFDPEAALFHRYHAAEDSLAAKFFLYFGHEIPEIGGAGYDASSPERSFNLKDLSDGLALITRDSRKFDLIVLSTCFGGTPHTIAALAPYTRTIIASPDNLHLSYLDLHQFEYLGIRTGFPDVNEFAKDYSRMAFQRLAANLQTAVTLAVYDVNRIQTYINSVDSLYDHTLAELSGQLPGSIEYYDCKENSAYVLPGMSEGVYIYYRPPLFGRSKNKQDHSGWQCCRSLN